VANEQLTLKAASMADALPMLAAALTRADTTAGAASIAELLQGAQAFTLDNDGGPVAFYAVKVVEHEKCRVLWAMAGAGRLPGHDLTTTGMQAMEHQARSAGAGQVAITTRRRGFVKKLEKLGYQISGITLRKNLT
jgi:hypothetical protein